MRKDDKKSDFKAISKDGLLNVHFFGLTTTEDFAGILNS